MRVLSFLLADTSNVQITVDAREEGKKKRERKRENRTDFLFAHYLHIKDTCAGSRCCCCDTYFTT